MNSFSSDSTRTAGAPAATPTRVHDNEGVSCGQFLRRARERRQLTLQQIAQITKIPLRHLDALERDEFAVLPSGMYRRAQVRAYADAVGLDPGVALSWLDRALEQSMPRPAAVPPPSAGRRTRALIAAGVGVTIGAVALATWARQPGAGDLASPAAPASVSQRVSEVVQASQASNDLLVATSGTVELASAAPRQHAEPAAVPPVSELQPGAERSDTAALAVSRREPELTVITEPVGARVTVNGVGWGPAPVTIRYLDPGVKRVRVTREGYRTEERVIQIEAAGPAAILRIAMQNAD